MSLLQKTVDSIGDLNQNALEEAQKRLDFLLKPQGSLGKLEDIAKKLAGISGNVFNNVDKKAIIIMCGDNGVYDEKVASFPKDVSMLVAETMLSGICGVAVLAKNVNAKLRVVDLGLEKDVKIPGIVNRKIRRGTSNFAKGAAMSREEAIKAIEIGIEETNKLIDEGYNLIGTGEVGIGNTTTSSAILYAFTKENLDLIVGRGAGLSDEGLTLKKQVIKKGVELNNPDPNDPIDVLAKVGGFDLAGLTGCYLGAAARRVPIVIDGFISGVAAICAAKINPKVKNFMITSHGSAEPGSKKIAEVLGMEPMLFMNMRLGEGTGCALAFHIIDTATKMMKEMGTFADIGLA
ncbi:MAG: nicotinate-nucleotide--dimethylbenzimidazole phosphoribosyltransferase [Spirochaetes bacterium GWC1_27_15]|nr:MAG: nicotinate-nucleotide--dimethylbenzimidazole phosphoribosyltransferase [Spirochaetes bacterium GWB1_27_13]OHD23939.1 MAG: nicotinate-nucleotide--dimethylbenzimidazole phosphoribosyltransferase [Spirochaetes bacterium GWC1_27_15]